MKCESIFFGNKQEKIEIDVMDANGRVVLKQKHSSFTGFNTILLHGIEKFALGLYNVRISVGEEETDHSIKMQMPVRCDSLGHRFLHCQLSIVN